MDLAIGLLLLLALAVFGATLAPSGWGVRNRRGTRIVAAAVIVGVALASAWPTITGRRAVDLTPVIGDRSDLVGTWRDGPDTLSLNEDGSYLGSRGAWSATTAAIGSRSGHSTEISSAGRAGCCTRASRAGR